MFPLWHSTLKELGLAAKAGIAMANVIAAITKAAVTNNMMRLISASPSVEGRRKKGVKTPAPACYSPLSV